MAATRLGSLSTNRVKFRLIGVELIGMVLRTGSETKVAPKTRGCKLGRYADVTCSKCFQVYPGNVMKRVTDRIKVGETRVPGSGYNDRTDRFENRVSILCPECASSRKRASCAVLLALIGVPAALFGLTAIPGLIKSGSLPKNDLTKSLSTAGRGISQASHRLLKVNPPHSNVDRAASDGAHEPVGDVQGDHPAAPADRQSDETAATDQTSTPEVQEAIQKAASTGKAIRWRSSESKGYAVASTPNEVGCRNVYFTDDHMGKGWQSPVQSICP